MNDLRVLHLAGSAVSEFYRQLSVVYAKEVLQPTGVTSYYALVHPDGSWQLGTAWETLSEKLTVQEAIARLPEIDLVVPHMFCFPGMTSYRALFEDVLGIPVVGSTASCTAIAANKSHTRNIVSAAGVRVAKGQQLRQGETFAMSLPAIVKPNSEDNSLGVTLVRNEEDVAAALQTGFEYDDTLLVEEFIPGRELRLAVIEREGELYVPATIEYLVSDETPIRTLQEKLELGSDGTPESQPKQQTAVPVCPATVSPDLFEQLAEAAKRAHVALGCRDYSLYDFRVDSRTNDPYMLEAGLFWCFSRISMISRMIVADERDLDAIVTELWQKAARRTRVAGSSLVRYSSVS